MGEYEHGLLDCDCLLIEPMDMTSRSVCTEGSLSLHCCTLPTASSCTRLPLRRMDMQGSDADRLKWLATVPQSEFVGVHPTAG